MVKGKGQQQQSLFIPTLHAQQQLNTLSGSGLGNYLRFLDHTTNFHEKMRLYFYPKIFGNAPVNDEDWDQWKVEFFEEEVEVNEARMFLPLMVFIVGLLVAGYLRLRRGGVSLS